MKCPFCGEELKSPFSQCELCGWGKGISSDLFEKETPTRETDKVVFLKEHGEGKKTEKIEKCAFCQEKLKFPFSEWEFCGWRKETPIDLLENEYPPRGTYKIVVFGDLGVGKKTFLDNCSRTLFKSDTQMTIGVNFLRSSMLIDGGIVRLQFWDFRGEVRFGFLFPTYMRGASGAIFMYDVSNYNSLAHIDDWLKIIRNKLGASHFRSPIIVVGNKADLLDTREVSRIEGIKFVKKRGVNGFIECSAKTGENVEEAIVAITRLIMAKSD